MREEGSDVFFSTSLPGGNSEREPPDPIPNSEVKTLSADDSLGPPHAKVGHCQAFIQTPSLPWSLGVYFFEFLEADSPSAAVPGLQVCVCAHRYGRTVGSDGRKYLAPLETQATL